MKHINLTKYDDINIMPSDELNSKTLYMMRARTVEHSNSDSSADSNNMKCNNIKKTSFYAKKIIVCAAVICIMSTLAVMGFQIFENWAFIPGKGIVTTQYEEIYVLENSFDIGDSRIEAISVIPIEDGENRGKYQISVLTNKVLNEKGSLISGDAKTMEITTPDGNRVLLEASKSADVGIRYSGVGDIGECDGTYTVSWIGKEAAATLKNIGNFIWSDHEYPTEQGLSFVAFPISENSKYITFDVMLTPESNNIKFWTQHCSGISYTPCKMVVKDVLGNSYRVNSITGIRATVSDSDAEFNINQLFEYRIEKIAELDRPLEAPISKIEVDNIEIRFEDIYGIDTYTSIVPTIGENISHDELPNGGFFIDEHGIMIKFDSIYTSLGEENDAYKIHYRSEDINLDFDEKLSGFGVTASFIEVKNASLENSYYKGGTSCVTYNGNENLITVDFSKEFTGDSLKENNGNMLNLSFGEEVTMRIEDISLTFSGEWNIDFYEK